MLPSIYQMEPKNLPFACCLSYLPLLDKLSPLKGEPMKALFFSFFMLSSSLWASFAELTIYADPELHMSGHAWIRLSEEGSETIACGMQIKGLIKESLEVPSTSALFTLPVSEEEAKQIQTLIEHPGIYHPFQNNCVDFVVHILDILGIEHPSFRQWNLSQPRLFYEWVSTKRQSCNELAPFK